MKLKDMVITNQSKLYCSDETVIHPNLKKRFRNKIVIDDACPKDMIYIMDKRYCKLT